MATNNATVYLRAKDETLQEGLEKAEASVKSFGSRVSSTMSSLGSAIANPFSLITKFATSTVGAVGSVISTMDAYGRQALAVYDVQRRAELKVGAAIKATGGAAGFTKDQMLDLASAFQEVTNFGDEATLSAMAVLSTYKNIRGDQFKDAMMSAMDMSEMLGMGLESSVTQISKALNDPIEGMSRLTRAGVQFTEQQEAMIKAMAKSNNMVGAQRIILDELESQYGGTAKALKDPLTDVANSMGDLWEMVGKAIKPIYEEIAKVMDVLITGGQNAVPVLEDIVAQLIEWGHTIAEWVEPYFYQLLDTLISVFSAGQVIVNNWQESVDVAFKAVQLGVVKLGGIIRHFFIEVIPSYLKWMAGDWVERAEESAYNFIQIYKNLFANLGNMISSFLNWVMGADGEEFEWVPLSRGLKHTIRKLPEIAEREKSSLERRLEATLGNAMDPLTKKWESRFSKNRRRFYELFEEANKKKVDDIKGEESDEYNMGALQEEDKVAKGESKAKFESLQGLYKRIAASAASGSYEDKMLDEMKKAQDTRKEIEKTLKSGEQLNGMDAYKKAHANLEKEAIEAEIKEKGISPHKLGVRRPIVLGEDQDAKEIKNNTGNSVSYLKSIDQKISRVGALV